MLRTLLAALASLAVVATTPNATGSGSGSGAPQNAGSATVIRMGTTGWQSHDVVQWGQVMPAWTDAGGKKNDEAMAGPEAGITRLYLVLRPGRNITVSVRTDDTVRGINPTARVEDNDDDVWQRTVTVTYRCVAPGRFKMAMEVRDDQASSEVVVLQWDKICGEGVRLGLNVALQGTKTLMHVIKNGKLTTCWDGKCPRLRMARPTEQATTFVMWSTNGSQWVKPMVRSDNPAFCRPELRGEGYRGVMVGEGKEEEVRLSVVYYCTGYGRARLSMSLSLETFKEVVVVWEKDCGGGANTALDVGTMFEKDDVVARGLVRREWEPSAKVPIVVDTDAVQKNFYLSAEPKAILSQQVTSSRVSLCRPMGTMSTHSPNVFKLSVFHYCKGKGDVKVTATILQQNYMPLEFSYTKRCVKLVQIEEEVSAWDEQQGLWLGGGLLCVVLGCCYMGRARHRSRRHRQGYSKVSTQSSHHDGDDPEPVFELECSSRTMYELDELEEGATGLSRGQRRGLSTRSSSGHLPSSSTNE